MSAPKNKIIVALDVPSQSQALLLVEQLSDCVGAFKVGLELFASEGPQVVEAIRAAGAEYIFLDAKFHDIPNTVANAARAAVRMGVWMFNLHASGGTDMMHTAVDAAADEADKLGMPIPLILGVTVLTSITPKILLEELSVSISLSNQVVRLARFAQDAGLGGVVASPHEIVPIKNACGSEFLVVTPGIRPASADSHDQKRIMTPAQALSAGADYIVVGRPITAAPNPRAAALQLLQDLPESC